MPSTSKAQQKFMGIVHGIQKGTIDPSSVSGAAKKAAQSMKKKSAKDYASTKHKGLPKKVKEEGFGGDLKGKDKLKFEKARKANGEQLGYTLSDTPDVKEERDYKEEYKKYGSSTKSKKYRAELNQYNRKKGTYGNGDGKDASHKGGKIVGFESQSKNRGRAEKSRLKKESTAAYGKSIEKIANDKKLKSISKKDRGLLLKIAKLMKKANESVNEKFNPRKLDKHLLKAINYLKQARKFAKEGKSGAVYDRVGDAKFELEYHGRKYMESVNEKTVSIGGEELLKFLMKRFKMSKSQAIASMKKHKMDMSFLKKESVNEIFPKGAGRKISKAMQKGYTLYTTDKRGKKVKKIKTYDSRQSAAVAMGKLMKNLDTDYFPKNVDGLMYIQESVNEATSLGADMLLGGIATVIKKAGMRPKTAKMMGGGFKVSKRDKVGFKIDVEIRGLDKKKTFPLQFETERGMLYVVIKNKPIKLGKYTMATQSAQNLKKVGAALIGDKDVKRIA